MIPFCEFKLAVTIHLSHGNEDPYTYEYLVDFSQAKVSAEQKSRFAEVICSQEGNSINIGSQIVYDPNAELATKASLDTSFQSSGSATASKPDFGKNVFIVLKQFTISLPLKRIVIFIRNIPSHLYYRKESQKKLNQSQLLLLKRLILLNNKNL